MVKLKPTGVKINTNLVWTSHNTGGVEFNTGVFAVYTMAYGLKACSCHPLRIGLTEKSKNYIIVLSKKNKQNKIQNKTKTKTNKTETKRKPTMTTKHHGCQWIGKYIIVVCCDMKSMVHTTKKRSLTVLLYLVCVYFLPKMFRGKNSGVSIIASIETLFLEFFLNMHIMLVVNMWKKLIL